MAKDISYKIDVNAQDAISEFKKVGKEAERAGKAIEKGLEVSPDTSKIDKFITNLKEAADEAENVGKAIQSVKKFAPEVDDSDIANVVLSLRKAGTEFDAIELKAKDLGTALKQVDVPQIKNLGTNVKGVKTDLDTMRSSSDQSRSVLANMVGNTAQDLGELGGVVGSVGVGIGQLAEYAVDGNISLQNLGKIAGPLAGLTALSLGVKTINERLNSIVESQKKYDEALADLKDSFIETGDAAETLDEQIRGNVLIEPPKRRRRSTGCSMTCPFSAASSRSKPSCGRTSPIRRSRRPRRSTPPASRWRTWRPPLMKAATGCVVCAPNCCI